MTALNTDTSFYPSFTTADELFAYLRSPSGGRLLIRDTDSDSYAIIYYKKGYSDMSLPYVQKSRSVIWNKATNTLVFASPGHAESLTTSTSTTPSPCDVFVLEEFVDGVMINLFFDATRNKWRLATRTRMDATNSFYGRDKSFATLFWETFASMGLDADTDLDTAVAYSWVLTHPAERIVVPCVYGIPKLTLITTTGASTLPPKISVLRPTMYNIFTSVQAIREFVEAEGRRRGHTWQGVCVYTPNMVRYKLRTREYDIARHLRGNQAKLAFLWLERWSQTQFKQYLEIYPEEEHEANRVIDVFKTVTKEAYQWYTRVYKNRELPLGQVSQKYRKLLWDAHASRSGCGYFPNMVAFMNNQDTARKLWLVNYETRYADEGTSINPHMAKKNITD